jgi:hypothetical protein
MNHAFPKTVIEPWCPGADVIRRGPRGNDNTIAVKESSVPSPARGMSMDQVEAKFGQPTSKAAAVGKPPITRWDYPGFVVYFEYNHVVHSVALSS